VLSVELKPMPSVIMLSVTAPQRMAPIGGRGSFPECSTLEKKIKIEISVFLTNGQGRVNLQSMKAQTSFVVKKRRTAENINGTSIDEYIQTFLLIGTVSRLIIYCQIFSRQYREIQLQKNWNRKRF